MKDVYVAKLGKTVGLKGHVKIFIESDFPNQFKKGATFTSNKNQTLTVKEFNAQRGIVLFDGIDDVDMAKKLTNCQLFSSYEQTREQCELDDKQYFWFDIIGCQISDNDNILGVVKDLHRYPSSDYLEVSTSKTLVEQGQPKTFLIPYIDQYILNVDTQNKIITTQDVMGILENS